MKKILVPTDFSATATKAAEYALAIAEKAGAEIILLNAFLAGDFTLPTEAGVLEKYYVGIQDEIKKQLDDLRQHFEKSSNVKIITRMYNGGTKDAILKCAADEKADMIIMGTLGASGLDRILFGSNASAVIGSSTIPVLAIPKNVTWKGLKNILFTTRDFDDHQRIDPVIELARLEDALVHFAVHINTNEKDSVNYLEYGKMLNDYEQVFPDLYSDVRFKTTLLEGKKFDEAVDRYLKEHDIDMLVMTTHKRGFWDSLFNRSVTKEMAYHLTVPLLAIPAE